MQKTCLFLSCLFLLLQPATAQDNNERKKTIKWPKYFKAQIPIGAPEVASISVVPFLWDADRLGYVQVGLDNKKISAVPDKPFQNFIQDYITKQYGDDYKKNGLHLLWIVKDLRINERTFMSSELAFTRLKADAYISTDGNAYHFVTGFDTVLRRGSMDVTAWHGQYMAEAFHLLLKQSLQKENRTASSTEEITIQQIEENEKQQLNIPVLTDAEYKEGVYVSFNEFLQNDPSITSFEAITENKKVKIYSVEDAEKKVLNMPWGLCKQGEIYKNEEGNLIPLERMGNGYIISTYLENSTRRNQNIFMGALLGGVIGAVAGSAASSSIKIYTVTAIPYIIKKQPEACAIDMTTGALTF
jgi:hypothetical protein